MTISMKLARETVNKKKRGASLEVLDTAVRFFRDTLGCMAAGAAEPAVEKVYEYIKCFGAPGECSIIGRPDIQCDAYFAALINGCSSHVHDYDDVLTSMVGHPSAVIVPTVIAVGESIRASGKDVLEAYIIGVEINGLMGRLICPEHNKRGWHSTQTVGVFGATAAAGVLLNLNERQLSYAFGIAASEASGLKANYGSMTKPLHAGLAAAKGIFCARFALINFTASKDAIESSEGFLAALTDEPHFEAFEKAISGNNSEFISPGLVMKPWPCCKGMHNAISAALEVCDENEICPEEIERIECSVLPFAKDILLFGIAETPTQGKFSMNYGIALAVLYRRLTMQDFEGDTIVDSAVIKMMRRIVMRVDKNLLPGASYYHPLESEQVCILMKNGRRFVKRCDYAKGTIHNPMTEEEMEAKVKDCFGKITNSTSIAKIFGCINTVKNMQDIRVLMQCINEESIFNNPE